jgi:adenylyl cyclase-associated protein
MKQIQSGSGTSKAPVAAGGPPPPPPPPPPLPTFDDNGPPPPPLPPSTGGASQSGGIDAVFEQINKGSAITAGLRKVDKSEMTHKNPSLRAGSTVPQRSESQTSVSGRGKSPIPTKKPDSLRAKKPGRKELDGNKWIVENFENTQQEVIEIPAELSHSILISKCNKCVLKVTGKANAIAIDNCNGLSILVQSLVSSLDIIKAPKVQVQVDGVVPTILLDQVDGAQIYLSNDSLNTEIFTSKCSAINVVLPPKDESEDDSKELAFPEQIRSVVKNGSLVSEIVEHAG